MQLYYGTKRLNTLNDSGGSSHVCTNAQRCKLIFVCFCIILYIGLSMKRFSSWDYVLPLAHAASECSDDSAHLLSLARGITAHIHNEGACLSPTRWLCLIYQWTPQQFIIYYCLLWDKKNCSKKPLVLWLNLYFNLRYNLFKT